MSPSCDQIMHHCDMPVLCVESVGADLVLGWLIRIELVRTGMCHLDIGCGVDTGLNTGRPVVTMPCGAEEREIGQMQGQ